MQGQVSRMHQAPISLPAGSMLCQGRYRVHRELNRGATAVVYAAEDLQAGNSSLPAFVALKVMNGPATVPVKVVKREIAFSAGVQHHENVVRLLDVFAENTQLVIVWELISGPDLLDLLNEHGGCLSEPLAAFYFCQLLQAVTFMHENGFCHRDIKPENCMIQRNNNQLKLIDFGLSKHLESAHTRGVGTPDYLSPEMLQVWSGMGGVAAPYDARAVDAWAMGVLAYLLVTGKYPFEDPQHPNNLPYTIQNVLAGRMRGFPDHVSPGCRHLITHLLRIDPTHRTTLQELAMNDWLLDQASAFASAVGRLDALEPLLVRKSLQPVSLPCISHQPAEAHTEVCSSTDRPVSLTQAEAASTGPGALQQLHPAVFQGWPNGNEGMLEPMLPARGGNRELAPTEPVSPAQQHEYERPQSTLSKVCTFLKKKLA